MSDIQKYQPHEIVRANNAVKLTNKLLAVANPQLIPYRKGDKWGFCTPNKRIVIECIYEEVTLFYEDRAAVKLNNKWGFINKQGHVVIQFIYESVVPEKFMDGLLVVRNGFHNKGVIDLHGNTIVPCVYCDVIILDELIYVTKNLLYDNTYQYGYLDRLGKLLTPTFYYYEYPASIDTELTYSTADGMRIVSDGYLGKHGNYIDVSKYQYHKKFSNGLAAVQYNNKWGFINTNGDVVIDFIYDGTDCFYGENTFVLKNGTYRLINHSGQEVFRFNDHIKISRAEYGYFTFEESHISQYGVDRKYGVLDNNGNIVIKAIYEEQLFFHKGYTETYNRKQNEKGIIDVKGLTYFKTSINEHVVLYHRGYFGKEMPFNLFIVELMGKYGIIDANKNEIAPCIYDLIYCFDDNYFKIEIGRKCGLINNSGKIILPCVYDRLELFDNGVFNGIPNKIAKILLNDKVGFLGLDGKEYWEV